MVRTTGLLHQFSSYAASKQPLVSTAAVDQTVNLSSLPFAASPAAAASIVRASIKPAPVAAGAGEAIIAHSNTKY